MTDETFEPSLDDTAAPGAGSVEVTAAAPGRPSVGVVWQEGAPGHWVIKLSGLPGAPPGQSILLGRPGANSHSPSIADHATPAGDVSRIGVTWIESPAGDTSGIGRIMLQRVSASAHGKSIDSSAFAAAANDNAIWVADLYGVGAIGCEPAVADLATGDTLVTWVGVDGHAHGRLYAPSSAHMASPGGDHSHGPENVAVNAALSDLGPVAATSDDARRLQITELRPGAFAVMWIALGESGPVLRGSLFLMPVEAGRSDDQGGWTGHPLSDVRLPPGFAGRFSAAPTDEKGAVLQVSYSGPDGGETVNVLSALDAASAEDTVRSEFEPVNLADDAAAAGQNKSEPAHTASPPETVGRPLREGGELETPTAHSDSAATPAKTTVAIAANPSVHETAPIAQPVQAGLAVAWQMADSTDAAQQIKLTLRDENGLPNGREVLVTDEADTDVAPAIASLGDGAAAAYVDARDGALVVEAFAGDGAQIGEPVVDSGDTGDIIEIALGSNGKDELALVYVRQSPNADGHKGTYGNILFQRYAVEVDDGGSELVQLGRDGKHDGNDAAAQLTVEHDDSSAAEPAVGRAPSVSGVRDSQLAILWVESDGGRETIRGSVLDHGGRQVLRIDLSGLLDDAGIAEGSRPTLLGTGYGDFLVSWLQSNGDGSGYVAMSALYTETTPGTWLTPELAVRLRAFDALPVDYSVAASSDDGGPFINMSWTEAGDGPHCDKVYTQRYDLDGHRLGRATSATQDDVVANGQPADDALELAGDMLAAAGVLDGEIVVFTEQRFDGELVLAAHVIDVSGSTESGDSSGMTDTSDLADKTFSTGVDQEAAINPLGGQIEAGLAISHINGVPITTATPVDVGAGWVQLREDGWLTVTPDAGYTGQVAFDYTVAGATNGIDADGRVVVKVEGGEAQAGVTLLNQVRAVPEGISTAADLKVADIAIADNALGTDGLSVTGLDGDMFKIVGNALYLKEGVELDFETKPTLSIEIQASHGNGLDEAVNVTLSIESESASGPPSLDPMEDTLVLAPGYGDAGDENQVFDLADSGYATYQDLLQSGALVQAGDDVVITLNAGDAADPHKVTLKGVELSSLSDMDFKFS